MNSTAELITAQFYEWEQRGRGWYVFPEPVDLEPPFCPLFFQMPATKIADDGIKHTLLSSLTSSVKSFFNEEPPPQHIEEDQEPLQAFPARWDGPLEVLRLSLPKDMTVRQADFEHMLIMLSNAKSSISFEIIATNIEIRLQIVCAAPDADYVESIIKSYYPLCNGRNVGNELVDFLNDDLASFGMNLGLKDEFMRPLHMAKSFTPDPYIGLFSILDNLYRDEQVFIQILFQNTINTWAVGILDAVSDGAGGSFFGDAPEMLPLAKEKVSSPIFAVAVRVIGQGSSHIHAREVTGRAVKAICNFTSSPYNSLSPLEFTHYEIDDYLVDMVFRQSRRLGMLLNSKEHATLVHFPSESIRSVKFRKETGKTKVVPRDAQGHEFVLGLNEHQGEVKQVTLPSHQRLKHMHVIGATGTGKSTFLLSSIAQDMRNGLGISVLDPHGDLIESILPHIPEWRFKDVIILDPADSEYPVGFNILQAHSDIEKEILSSDLVAVFRRLSTSWGDQMNSVLANAILAFLESSKGGTLVDLRRFLIEKPFRDEFLRTVTDPNLAYYWQKEFPLLKTSSIGPILTRLDTFLRPKLIRNMVAQRKSLDFEQILNTNKILLVKLSQGLIGNENSYLLGTFIVSKLQLAAMARQAQASADRTEFYVYIDEFQHFITPSMSSILSGARKYSMGLILAHQDMQQVTKYDSELASAIIANAGTRICFRLGDIDAKRLAEGFSFFEAKDLQNLNTGEALVRIERPEYDFNLSTASLETIEEDVVQKKRDTILQLSRETYGTLKDEIEQGLTEVITLIAQPPVQEVIKPFPKEEQHKETTVPKPTVIPKQPTQHRYLQTLVKKMAESRGFKASIEEPTPDGKGRIDVSLERNGRRIAVEIQDTTKDEWEFQNIEKCLSAGYEMVVECSNDRKAIERLRRKVEKAFTPEQLKRILVASPEELFLYLDSEIAKEASSETRVKGYRVKVDYNAISEGEAESIKKAMAKTMLSIKKK